MTEGGAGPGLPRAPAQGPFRTQRQQRSLSLHGHRRPPSRGQGWAPWSFPGRSLPPPGFTVPGSPRRARSFEVEPPPGPRGSPPPPKRPETQLLGVVGLRGWWELVERVRGPSPTLARRKETGRGGAGSRPDSSPTALHLCTLTSHCALEGALTPGVFPEHLLCAAGQAEGFGPAGASPHARTLRLAPAGPPPAR